MFMSPEKRMKENMKRNIVIGDIRDELSKYGRSDKEIVDILVKFLYGIKNVKNKTALWMCYGDIIYENLENKIRSNVKEIECQDCGKWFEVGVKDTRTCRCEECSYEHRRRKKTATMRKLREKQSCGQTKNAL